MPIIRNAHAKINLTLEVLGLRSDGFHEIRSVMQMISLCDTLTFEKDASGMLTLTGGTDDAPPAENNLVLRAARALQATMKTRRGARIHLEKRIPVGAGLGGGSSDAAATLKALNALWGAHRSEMQLTEIAASLGSDIPFFLSKGSALVTGRGERITPAGPLPELQLVVAKPAESLPTPKVYAEWDRRVVPHDGVNHSARLLSDPANAGSLLWNDLHGPAVILCPEIARILDHLKTLGIAKAMVSGSGSAVFGVCESGEQAMEVAESLTGTFKGVWAAPAVTIQDVIGEVVS